MTPSPAITDLLRAATAELLKQGVDRPDFTVEKVLNLVQIDPILSKMDGRRELFEFLSPVSDAQLRRLLNDLFS
jgi:hypothetical protein